MTKNIYGHGDVIVKKIDKIPDNAAPLRQETKNPTLAFGEVTGHSHQISAGIAALFTYDEKTYMRVTSPIAALTHEEHAKIELPAGDYQIEIQREYEPDGWRKVLD